MSASTMHIAVDVGIDGAQGAGRAGNGAGPPQPFSGWLGLIGALDRLLAAPGSARSHRSCACA